MIVVIGAGIAGLSLGWQLAASGANVTIIEKADILNAGTSDSASLAAGAYLEPRPGHGKLRALEWASLEMWPSYAAELSQQSGIDLGFRQDGITHVAFDDDLAKLALAQEQHVESVWQVQTMQAQQLHQFEPGLSGDIVAGFHLPQVCTIDARQTCLALTKAFQKAGGRLLQNSPVRSLDLTNGQTVITNSETIEAKTIVIAAGYGTNSISDLPADIPKSRPVRGVMLELALADKFKLRCSVKRSGTILLPLQNGNLLIGSSHEEGEDEIAATDIIVDKLIADAALIVPQVAGLRIVRKHIGIRALVGDGLLRLGRSRLNKNIFYSLSHAGSGFLRAPLIARELADIILDVDNSPRYIAAFFRQ